MKTISKASPVVNGAEIPSLIPAAPLAAPVKHRRPRTYLAAALVLIIGGGFGVLWAVNASGKRSPVVGVAATVQWGEVITAQDFDEVQAYDDVNLRPVSWGDRGLLIGKRAGTLLLPGSLLTADSVMGDPVPAAGQALVGVSVKAAQAPLEALSPQDHVQLVVSTQVGAGQHQAAIYSGVVVTSTKADVSGARTIDVLVASKDGPAVAVAAAAGTVSVVLVPRS